MVAEIFQKVAYMNWLPLIKDKILEFKQDPANRGSLQKIGFEGIQEHLGEFYDYFVQEADGDREVVNRLTAKLWGMYRPQ